MEVSKRMFGFERLDAWHNSVEFAGKIYKATRYFPVEEKSGPVSQLKFALVNSRALKFNFKKYYKP